MPKKTAPKKDWSKTRLKSSKNSFWSTASSVKVKKQTKLALLALAFIVFLLVFGKVVQFAHNISQPLSLEGSQQKRVSWDGQSSLNMVVNSGSVSLLNFDPVNKKVTIIHLPNQTYLKVSDKFGFWKAGSVYGLGQSDKIPQGNILLVKSAASFFGLPVDGFLQLPGANEPEQLVEGVRQNPLKMFLVIPKLKTNLTPIELLKLFRGLSQVRFDKVKTIDLGNNGLLESDKLADGTQVLSSDPARLDSLSVNFADSKISAEGLTISVYNATSHPGLAQYGARMVSNIGGDIIITSNLSTDLARTVIFSKSEGNSYTARRLGQIFGFSCSDKLKCDKIMFDLLKQENFRADINVVLGEDFYNQHLN